MEKLGGGPGALGSAPRDAQKCTHLVSSPFMGGGGSHGVSPGVAAWLLDSHGPPRDAQGRPHCQQEMDTRVAGPGAGTLGPRPSLDGGRRGQQLALCPGL